ncbi:MAG TPA: carbonic anhydrase [Pirellulales bacterium]|nr:carbonic anhydrase [Pirellulales bacterium]
MSHASGANLPATAEALELGPSLPLTVFSSTEPWNDQRIGALALYCSDGRWGEAFDEFCHKHLQIPRYDRWAVPGGPAWLAAHENSPQRTQALEQLDFLVRVHELHRIVLVTHFGCSAYGLRLNAAPRECLKPQMSDVRVAAKLLRNRYADMRVEGYLAMRDARTLAFHEIGVWGGLLA